MARDPYDEAGNTDSQPKKPDIKNISDKEAAGSGFNYQPSGSKTSDFKHEGQIGGGYQKKAAPTKPAISGNTFLTLAGFARRNRKKLLGGGGSLMIVAITIVVVMLLLTPFKILHIVSNLQQHFYASPSAAIDKGVGALEANYLKDYVLKGLGSDLCRTGRTVDKTCQPQQVLGNSFVHRLYKTWRLNRLENKLAVKYNLEFAKSGNTYFIKAPGMNGNGAVLDDKFLNSDETVDDFIQRSNDPQFKKVNRQELRARVKYAFDGETRYKKVYYRYRVGRLLEEKYGIRRCIVFCTTRDSFNDWKGHKKDAAKAYVIDRVITPRGMALSIAMRCVLEGMSAGGSVCKVEPDPPSTSCNDGDCALAGRRETNWERNLRADLANYRAANLGTTKVKDLLAKVDEINKKGYAAYLFENLRLGDGFRSESDSRQNENIKPASDKEAAEFYKTFSEKLTKGGNIVGALDTLASMFKFLGDAGPELHKLTYITNSATMVQTYAMYRTYADEIKTGKVDSTIVGSFTDTLRGSQNQVGYQRYVRIIGGNSGAEQTPLYQELIDGNEVRKSRPAVGLLSSTAYAATKLPNPNTRGVYICNNQRTVDLSKSLVCDEENLQYNKTASEVTTATESEGLAQLITISNAWVSTRNSIFGGPLKLVNWALSQLSSFITSVLSILPGSDDIAHAIEKWYRDLMQWLSLYMIPSLVGENTSGGRMFDTMAGGADVSGNESAHSLGGRVISSAQAFKIQQDQQSIALAEYHSQPLLKRVFDTNSDYSPVTKIAMKLPDNRSDLANSLASSFGSNFFSRIFSSFSSMFSLGKAKAAGDIGPDPFGVSQYGYPDNDPGLKAALADPAGYWDRNCHDPTQPADSPQVNLAENSQTYNWNKVAGVKDSTDSRGGLNSVTGMPENYETNPCLLIQAAVGSAGGIYDSGLLTQDDLSEGSTASQTDSSTLPQGSAQDLAKQLKQYINSGKVRCTTSGCPDVVRTADGISIKGGQGCLVDSLQPALVGMLLKLAQMGHTYTLSALCSDHHNDGLRGHSGGRAADFNTIDSVFMGPNDVPWDQAKIQAGQKLDQDIASFMPQSTGFGQIQCHPPFDFLKGFNVFNDSCHHQHVQVEI